MIRGHRQPNRTPNPYKETCPRKSPAQLGYEEVRDTYLGWTDRRAPKTPGQGIGAPIYDIEGGGTLPTLKPVRSRSH